MNTLLIDDINISVTVRYYFNLLGTRTITECTDNFTNRPIHLRGWQGKRTSLAIYVLKTLDIVIANRR